MARAVTLAPLFVCHGTIDPHLVHLYRKFTSIHQMEEKLWGGCVHLCYSPVRHYPAFFFASLFFFLRKMNESLHPPSITVKNYTHFP